MQYQLSFTKNNLYTMLTSETQKTILWLFVFLVFDYVAELRTSTYNEELINKIISK